MSSDSSRNRFILIGAGIVLLVALYFGWQWAGQDSTPSSVAKKDTPATKQDAVKSADTLLGSTTPKIDMSGAPNRLITVEEGDVMIDEILRSNKEIPQMARDLHDLVKKLNGEAQVNASRHLVNLTSDEDYGLIAGYLTDAKMNPDVVEVLFSDLMNRNRILQMPLFMNLLKNPAHPQNEQVRNVLTILAGEDHGTDWAKWDAWAQKEIESQKAGQ
jgi:hypothetical protein